MKQLLLYFLFFVFAAFIFIQCAKLFPSDNKPQKHQPKGPEVTNPAQHKRSDNTALYHAAVKTIKPVFNKRPFTSYFNNPAFALHMMKYLKDYSFLNYHYLGINNNGLNGMPFFRPPYTGLGNIPIPGENDRGLQASNSTDQQ